MRVFSPVLLVSTSYKEVMSLREDLYFTSITKCRNTYLKNLFQLSQPQNSPTAYECYKSLSTACKWILPYLCNSSWLHYQKSWQTSVPEWGDDQHRWDLSPSALWCEAPPCHEVVLFFTHWPLPCSTHYMFQHNSLVLDSLLVVIECKQEQSHDTMKRIFGLTDLSSLCSDRFLSGQLLIHDYAVWLERHPKTKFFINLVSRLYRWNQT